MRARRSETFCDTQIDATTAAGDENVLIGITDFGAHVCVYRGSAELGLDAEFRQRIGQVFEDAREPRMLGLEIHGRASHARL